MKTKKFISNPESLMSGLLEGFAEAHKELVILSENHMIISNKLTETDRVTIVAQGNSGYEPATSGSIGEGMVDISVVGNVLATPGPQAYPDAIKLADKGKGVLYIVLSHAGDTLIGNLTMKKCAKGGLNMVKVVTQEDTANAPRSNAGDRGGLVGCTLTYKVAGAAAAEGKNLEEVAVTAQQSADNVATLAIAVSGATHPAIGNLLVDLDEDEMEIGTGQHGEGSGGRQTMKSANEAVKITLDDLLADLDIRKSKEIVLIFSGTGATTLMELFIIYRRYVSCLKKKNVEIAANYVGKPLTIQEQAGLQMFMARMDDGLLHYQNAPCNAPYIEK